LLSIQLNDKYQEFVVASERDEFITKLQEVEDWLYEDGEDETKGVYNAKLEELKKVRHFGWSLLLAELV
jgi:heat shock 70kDa protein 4